MDKIIVLKTATKGEHVRTGTLKNGRNQILVEWCQEEQTAPWAQTWGYQLRVCDYLGGAVPVRVVDARKQEKTER